MKLNIVPFALLFVTACTTLPDITEYAPQMEERHEIIQNYKLGEVRRVFVGDAIIEKGELRYTLVSDGRFEAVTSVKAGGFSITRGRYYQAIYVDSDDGGIYVQGNPGSGMVTAAKVDQEGRLLHQNLFYHNVGGWQNHAMVTIAQPGTKLFEPGTVERRFSPESVKMEIIYLGVSGDDMKGSYREYKDDIARPAFYQDLTYDLRTSPVIRYKNFRIEVISASNEELEYRVLEH